VKKGVGTGRQGRGRVYDERCSVSAKILVRKERGRGGKRVDWEQGHQNHQGIGSETEAGYWRSAAFPKSWGDSKGIKEMQKTGSNLTRTERPNEMEAAVSGEHVEAPAVIKSQWWKGERPVREGEETDGGQGTAKASGR